MNPIDKYEFDKEVKLALSYYSHQIKNSKTKEEAEEQIKWYSYLLGLIVEKYFE